MANAVLERLRGARRIELYAALVLLALAALFWLNSGAVGRDDPQKTALELRLEHLLAQIEGAGEVNVMISEDADEAPMGVVIVADGAADIQTYISMQSAVKTLLGIDISKIKIISGSGWPQGDIG